jgi:Putative prokaryotic signal transducing protein
MAAAETAHAPRQSGANAGARRDTFTEVSMNCPKCGGTLDEGNLRCASCGAAFELVEREVRGEDMASDYIEVLRIEDPTMGPVVTSLLEAEGIPVVVVNDATQDLIGLGRFASGYNPLLGPAVVCVERKNEDAARALIAEQWPAETVPRAADSEATD